MVYLRSLLARVAMLCLEVVDTESEITGNRRSSMLICDGARHWPHGRDINLKSVNKFLGEI